MRLLLCIPLFVVLLAAGGHCGSYLITAPATIQPGYWYAVNVDFLNGSVVTLEATLLDKVYNGTIRDYTFNVLANVSGTFNPDTNKQGVIYLYPPMDRRCTDCRLNVRGRGDLQFEQSISLSYSRDVVVIFVQTDKAIYKPGQKVKFRTIAVNPSLRVYRGPMRITIMDPNNNKIKVMPAETPDEYGVIEGELVLSEQPMFGDWRIHVEAEDILVSHTQPFTVANYELPRFEITVELPPFGLKSDTSLDGTVTAKYTFGEDVSGLVELHIGPNVGPDLCGNAARTTQISFDIDGTATFEIPREDVERVVSLYDGTKVKVTAFVTEASSGVRLNGSSVITYYQRDSKVDFLDNTPNVFKPGLPYTAYIQVTTPDGKSPPASGDDTLSVYTTVSYEQEMPDQNLYTINKFEGTFPLPGTNISLPASGVAQIDIDIPDNATRIYIKATFRGVYQVKTVEKSWSQSNNYLRLTVSDENIKSNQKVNGKVEGTEALETVYYKVFVQGREVFSDMWDGSGQTSFMFELEEIQYAAPVAQLVAYYYRGQDEVVADSVAYQVDDFFQNKVSVSVGLNETEPGVRVPITVSAYPDSMAYVLAVDQSVLLLKSGNDITQDKVTKGLSVFDRSSQKPSSPDYALSYSSTDVRDVFEKIGLVVISDLEMEEPDNYEIRPVTETADSREYDSESSPTNSQAKASRDASGKTGPPALQEVKRIRNIFPETWLWDSNLTCANGAITMEPAVPDTITSWVISAFASSPRVGLGVAPTTSKVKVFRPFFISLNYPSIVTRGERVVIQATVFNYLDFPLPVTVTLKESNGYENIVVDSSGGETVNVGDTSSQILVMNGEQGVVFFPINTTNIGLYFIEVTAESSLAADGVRRVIKVEPEGAAVSYNSPVFINLDQNNTITKVLTFTPPPSIVVGSERTKISITGDLLDPSLTNLESLLELPTGCGEQSMVKFAPDVYIAKYLQATGQYTRGISRRIRRYLDSGYQRQLTYQRYDKSFSAFGNNDPTGSTWLTAMVAGTFAEAENLTFIDPYVVIGAVDWLVDRQSRDGSFESFGKVLDPNTQTARTAEGLTAFILTTLLQTSHYADNPWRIEKWSNATQRAISHLEQKISANAITDQLSLAMVSYALAQANSPGASQALDQLNALSNTEGALTYWGEDSSSTGSTDASLHVIWRPPVVQARPVDILTTSYAILAMTAAGQVQEAFPSVRWLVAQRNANGGFASSQDTNVALQALAAYAIASSRPNNLLVVSVTGNEGAGTHDFTVDEATAFSLRAKELKVLPTQTTVTATGTGIALLEMLYFFNVNDELSTPSFDVSTVLLDDDIDSFNLMICTKWLEDRDTGMVVQEISIPSGFEPDLSTLGNVVGLQRSERRGNTVAVYFDKISKSSLCYSLVMSRTAKVAKSQRNFVRTFDYYQPSDQSTVFYHPRKLKESTICDVCDQCCQTQVK